MPPIHLLYIAQAIKRAGHEAEIVDLPYLINTNPDKFKVDDDSSIDHILSKEFDILGIGSVVSAYIYCERVVKRVRAERKGVPIILGGSVGLPVKDLWEKHAPVDYICESDGELVMEKFMRAYPGDIEAVKKIPGLHYLNSGGKYTGSKPELPMNLDYIPFLDYGDTDIEYYSNSLRAMVKNVLSGGNYTFRDDEKFFPIIFSRGCVYKCTFCFHFNYMHRKHSAKYIADNIEYLMKEYGVTAFLIIDDLTIINKKWLHGILDEIMKRKLNISFFSGGGKPGVVDKEILIKMKQAGCRRLSFGVESGSKTILDVMNKDTTVEDNFEAVSLVREVGIPSTTNIVFGMPKETAKTMDETAKFLIDLDLSTNDYYASLAVPYPGSPLFKHCIDKGMIKDSKEYLMNIGGYGDYKINLTDMRKRKFLAKVIDVAYKVDTAYYLRRKKYLTAIRLMLQKHLHTAYFSFLPADLRMKLKLKQRLSKIRVRRIRL